ncbi:MAG: cell division protein BolA [Sedimenticola sp.]
MTVCTRVKGYMRVHERVADFFSLLAVALLFSTIWAAIEYQSLIFQWTQDNIIVHGSALIVALVADVFLIFLFLNIGSSRLSTEDDNACFGTFRGRRHGGTSIGTAFSNWVDHMEHVNKKHR